MFSSKNTRTILKYELNYRNFFLVTQGSVKVKMIPTKSAKYLYTIKDYDNFEFISPVNPWDVQSQFKSDFDKLKTLEVTLNVGQIIVCCFVLTIIFYIIFFPFFKIILIKFENIQYFLETLISFVLIYSVTSEIVKYQKSKEQTKTSGSK